MPQGYLKEQLKSKAIRGLMIIDEVQAGVGRTGKSFWAFEQHGWIRYSVVAKGMKWVSNWGSCRENKSECMKDKFMFHTYV